jgi:hypothetical protein
MQALPAPAESLCIVEMKTTEGGVVVDTASGREQQVGPTTTSFLNIGLQVNALNFSSLNKNSFDFL